METVTVFAGTQRLRSRLEYREMSVHQVEACLLDMAPLGCTVTMKMEPGGARHFFVSLRSAPSTVLHGIGQSFYYALVDALDNAALK